jgi:DNA invertase Pin-like site-specific DNA recombinase
MLSSLVNSKIRPDHLDRQAFIYIRQSTLAQVRDNTGSTTRQYELSNRAINLGWSRERIVVIDQDQGHSGASMVGRDGFQFLIAQVGLGLAGAVISIEASRLARSCGDWYRLLEICALTNTLVIDEEGIYDPGQYNDRLLLGFKGTMSEAELHWLYQRLIGGKLAKAEKGELRWRLPVGMAYDLAQTGQIVLDPDEEIQQTIRLVFSLFDQTTSALAVVSHFQRQHLRFPTRHHGGAKDGELVWQSLTHSRVLSVLHNPVYAGTYVYGRTKTRSKPLPGEAVRIKGYTRQVKRADWPIVLLEHHPGYITWEQFLCNQKRLEDNLTFNPQEHRGAVREGAALLQGLVLCGRCGRRMSVRYQRAGQLPTYQCNQLHNRLGIKTCQSIRGDRVDAVVAKAFLEAIEPAHLAVAVATLDQLEGQARQNERQWKLRLERVQYEADMARRRVVGVDPENRLVLRTLEREWNEKLTVVEQLEQEYVTLPKSRLEFTSSEDRQRVMELAQDLPVLWEAPTTTQSQRKQLVRFLIKDVSLNHTKKLIEVNIRWQTGALTPLVLPRLLKNWEERQTAVAVVNRIRALAATHTDRQIAELLNTEQLKPGMGGEFTHRKVNFIRWSYEIASGCPEEPGCCPSGQRGDGRYSAMAAAKLLNVNVSTIAEWCKQGKLEATRAGTRGPRWIKLTPEVIKELRSPVSRKWKYRENVQKVKIVL